MSKASNLNKVEVIATFGGGDAMVPAPRAQVLKGRELPALVVKDGTREGFDR